MNLSEAIKIAEASVESLTEAADRGWTQDQVTAVRILLDGVRLVPVSEAIEGVRVLVAYTLPGACCWQWQAGHYFASDGGFIGADGKFIKDVIGWAQLPKLGPAEWD